MRRSVLWAAVFGLLGGIFIRAEPQPLGGARHLQREKNAVWVDLVNMLLWFVTAVYGAVLFFMYRRARTLHTGRAAV